uniref:Chitin binding-like protein 3 n=1 Tax=Trypanosoma cruzi TaxID=5693 RepID=Q8WSI6_TRYCR|nr:chitin binding-like protein 3 [Trypanosoma cruzi]
MMFLACSSCNAWCGIKGAWDECAWILAQQLHVPTVSSRCRFADEGFSGCAGRCAMDGAGTDNSKTTWRQACGRCSVCADAWQNHKIPAMAFTAGGSHCVFL